MQVKRLRGLIIIRLTRRSTRAAIEQLLGSMSVADSSYLYDMQLIGQRNGNKL